VAARTNPAAGGWKAVWPTAPARTPPRHATVRRRRRAAAADHAAGPQGPYAIFVYSFGGVRLRLSGDLRSDRSDRVYPTARSCGVGLVSTGSTSSCASRMPSPVGASSLDYVKLVPLTDELVARLDGAFGTPTVSSPATGNPTATPSRTTCRTCPGTCSTWMPTGKPRSRWSTHSWGGSA